MQFLNLALVIFAVSSVALADVCIKQATIGGGSLAAMLFHPWMIAAYALYLFQIIVFAYLFIHGEELLYVGILQTALYALIVISAGFLLFNEGFTHLQIVGGLLAIAGAILMNL